jgi:hypothetical protein
MKPEDHDLEDITFSLASIREQLESGFQASTTDRTEDMKGLGRPDEEVASRALEEYLASRLQQIGEVASETRELKGLKTGNGWDPTQVPEYVFKIDPIPVKRAIEVALASKRTLKERIIHLFRRPKQETKIVGTPTVEFIPIWRIKGFHECYYLRTNNYKVNVKNDVVGVEVEGASRDLMLEKKHRRLIPSVILEKFQMLGSILSSESKYFVISDVTELATKKTESELIMTGQGKSLTQDEEMAIVAWRSKRIFDLADLKVRGAKLHIRECTVNKDAILTKFREKVLHMPERFKQILSNRLQISELKRIYVPFIRISVQKGLVPQEVIVNGSSGELARDEMLELVE